MIRHAPGVSGAKKQRRQEDIIDCIDVIASVYFLRIESSVSCNHTSVRVGISNAYSIMNSNKIKVFGVGTNELRKIELRIDL